MFICLDCGKEFNTEQAIQKHFLTCWKENHSYHKSKDAPRSANVVTREVNDNVLNFFNSLKGVN